jgi:regulator of protease activity HflC (stomatin/prohibitin superfamily)
MNPYILITTVIICFIAEAVLLGLAQIFGFYTIVHEREARVYVLFGEIVAVISEPGLHFLWPIMGWKALVINWLGTAYSRQLSLDQKYIRSIPVNTEEGTPMGIGVWYEMFITDPVAHIFKNVDPEGSLTANAKNATIKSLSNLPLSEMLVKRHQMSKLVRDEVTAESTEWGYKLGSVYIRKVHFQDHNMIRQIEEKVVNQLRQVTSAIEQDGLNQVNVITSKADKEASVEFAKAAAVRPQVVSETLLSISKDPDVLSTLFDILECERMAEGNTELTLIPKESQNALLPQLLAAQKSQEK